MIQTKTGPLQNERIFAELPKLKTAAFVLIYLFILVKMLFKIQTKLIECSKYSIKQYLKYFLQAFEAVLHVIRAKNQRYFIQLERF